MRGIDLRRYRFDTDLTFAVLWMNADGTVYHRYGGRDVRGAGQWLSTASLKIGMQASLTAHQAHQVLPAANAGEPLVMERIPSFVKRDKGKCIHCHSVQPALYEEELAAGTWTQEKTWRYMPPSRIGLDLNRDDQRRIADIAPNSAAADAGLRIGDRLVSVSGQPMATASDLMFELDQYAASGGKMVVEYLRSDEVKRTVLNLTDGWKTGTPLDFSWRPFKWGLTPAPGFGGPQLKRPELLDLGLIQSNHAGELPFAFRVSYLVTWGDNKRFGDAVSKAGLLKGDIFLSAKLADTKKQPEVRFTSGEHFHSWWRLTRTAGETMELDLLRGEERRVIRLKVIE
ncbi:MAG: serine protease Do [Planctomycetota bacterium]|jgi:serine protease Do